MPKKTLANLIIVISLLILTYVVFGIFIIGSENNMDDLVEGYQAGYEQNDTSQAKGFDLIKSNWNRVSKDKSLMQRQVNEKGLAD
jgi:hypothetical protein